MEHYGDPRRVTEVHRRRASDSGGQLNLEFFERLYADQEFCSQLGRVTLASGQLESDLRAYLVLRGVSVSERESTLGALTKKLQDHRMLSENGVEILRTLKRQRNYLTHSLFDLFSVRVAETLLPSTGLVPFDVTVFTEKAWELEQNLAGLSEIVEKRIAAWEKREPDQGGDEELLFRP